MSTKITRILPSQRAFPSAVTPGTSSCNCRHAHSATPITLTGSPPPPPPPAAAATTTASSATASSSSSSTSSEHYATWNQPSYLARYRDPIQHDVSSWQRSHASTSSKPHAAPSSRSRRTSSNTTDYKARAERDENSPRSRRLAMERLWSGGEASPPIPLHDFRKGSGIPKHALLFPGSGSQYVGMGNFLKGFNGAKDVWHEAEDALEDFEQWAAGLRLEEMQGELGALGKLFAEKRSERKSENKLHKVVFDGPQDTLTKSSNAQPAILITSLAFLRTLEQDFGTKVAESASAILGHSSGEYSAAVAAGAISLQDAVRLTRLHGFLTSYSLALPSIGLSPATDAADMQRGQMSALVINPGHSHEEVTRVIKQIRDTRSSDYKGSAGTVEIASFNSSAQVVLAGSREGIMRASEYLRDSGIASRAADLPVSAPFHCSFMKPAAEGMRAALHSVKLRDPAVPVVSCLDGSLITSTESLITNLVKQIQLPVRWSQCISNLAANDVSRLVFLGPGKALANLARKDLTNGASGSPSSSSSPSSGNGSGAEVVSVATEDDMKSFREKVRLEREKVESDQRRKRERD